MSDFKLLVGANEYGGWKSLRVSLGMEALAGSFAFELAERWAGRDVAWPVLPGARVSVVFDGKPVITGYVDAAERSLESASVQGKDRAVDLVECSAQLSSWEFTDTPVESIARQLCQPYDVALSVQQGLRLGNVPKKFSVDPGATAGHALEELCRIAGVLPVSDGQGGIVLTRAGLRRCTTAIVEGENLLAGRQRRALSGRFAEYRVLGQHKGGDDHNGSAAAAPKGTARDAEVRIQRVLTVRAEGNVTAAQAGVRAEWEATVRAARSTTLTVTVRGWTQGDGSLWALNTIVPVRSKTLDATADWLITALDYELSLDSGSTTTMELRAPESFLPSATVKSGTVDRTWKEIPARGV